MARVNMFLKMMRGGKVKKSYKAADQDIARASEEPVKEIMQFVDFEEIELQLAKLDLIKSNISVEEQNEEFDI